MTRAAFGDAPLYWSGRQLLTLATSNPPPLEYISWPGKNQPALCNNRKINFSLTRGNIKSKGPPRNSNFQARCPQTPVCTDKCSAVGSATFIFVNLSSGLSL